MGYKCEYDGKRACDNCKYRYGSVTCQKCNTVGNTCPSVRGCKYPHDEGVCKKCLFEPKEREVTTMIQDSGERREFDTGAVRDMADGKGLMVVMPAAAILRLSKHYEYGAKKYGKFNWQKGIPVDSFIDSALRHIFKYLDGWDDEDHLAAAAFNILGAMEMEAHKPDMQNIPAREGKQKFNYLNDKRV